MSYWQVDTSEVEALARRIPAVGAELGKLAEESTKKAGDEHVTEWRGNAKRTSGRHGRWYPSSITATFAGSALGVYESETGPVIGRKQGSMGRGFEHGSANQPPHLDGTKAFDVVEPKFVASGEVSMAAAVEKL